MKPLTLILAVASLSASGLVDGQSASGGSFRVSGGTIGGGGTARNGSFGVLGRAEPTVGATSQAGSFVVSGGLHGVVASPTVGGDAQLVITPGEPGQVILSWDQSGYLLETRSSLGANASWQTVEPAPTQRTLTVTTSESLRYYRLRKP
jgi:hypothetical protein